MPLQLLLAGFACVRGPGGSQERDRQPTTSVSDPESESAAGRSIGGRRKKFGAPGFRVPLRRPQERACILLRRAIPPSGIRLAPAVRAVVQERARPYWEASQAKRALAVRTHQTVRDRREPVERVVSATFAAVGPKSSLP